MITPPHTHTHTHTHTTPQSLSWDASRAAREEAAARVFLDTMTTPPVTAAVSAAAAAAQARAV